MNTSYIDTNENGERVKIEHTSQNAPRAGVSDYRTPDLKQRFNYSNDRVESARETRIEDGYMSKKRDY